MPLQFPPSPPWSDSEAEAFRDFIHTPLGRRVCERLAADAPSASSTAHEFASDPSRALGFLEGYDRAQIILAALTVPPSTMTPDKVASEKQRYPDLDDDTEWKAPVPAPDVVE